MNNLIIALHNTLNLMKDFTVGYSSKNKSQCLISYRRKIYKLTIEEVCVEENEHTLICETNKL